jgi:hypothetical protein
MNTAQEIIDAAGRDQVKARFGVQDRVIQHHLHAGKLPAAWYFALADMTGKTLLPVNLFSFKGLDT